MIIDEESTYKNMYQIEIINLFLKLSTFYIIMQHFRLPTWTFVSLAPAFVDVPLDDFSFSGISFWFFFT